MKHASCSFFPLFSLLRVAYCFITTNRVTVLSPIYGPLVKHTWCRTIAISWINWWHFQQPIITAILTSIYIDKPFSYRLKLAPVVIWPPMLDLWRHLKLFYTNVICTRNTENLPGGPIDLKSGLCQKLWTRDLSICT